MTTDFKKSLKLPYLALLFSGIQIFPTENKFWTSFYNFLFYFNFVWLYTDVLGEFYWLVEGIQVGKNFGELSLIAPCTTICLLATAKSTPMFYYRNVTAKVIKQLEKMHPKVDEKPLTETEKEKINALEFFDDKTQKIDEEAFTERVVRKIVHEETRFLNFVILLLCNSSAVVITVFTMLPLLSMSYDYYEKGETELKLPFLIKYFFDPFTKSRWPLVYLHQVWSTFIAGFNVFGADTFLYAFCTYAQMHFRILCHHYESLVPNSSIDAKERLRVLVKRHQKLIELVDQVELVYSKSTLFNIVSSSVLICLSAFNVTFLDDGGAVFAFFTFLMMSLSQISLLCLFGDMLMRSSTRVSDAIYKFRWYDTDSGTKRSIFLILIRAQKPCKLTAANFADLNLSAFTTILSRSWSYFALLRTVYK